MAIGQADYRGGQRKLKPDFTRPASRWMGTAAVGRARGLPHSVRCQTPLRLCLRLWNQKAAELACYPIRTSPSRDYNNIDAQPILLTLPKR